jgi:hypothetical protein
VRQAFVHEAVLSMRPGADVAAAGAAVTVALCGHWEHEPPCPLAPHSSVAERVGDEVRVRTLFAVEPELESDVRERIDGALAGGRLVGPDGAVTTWRLKRSARADLLPAESSHAERLRWN